MKTSYYNGLSKGLGFGLVLLTIGSILLAFNMGIIPIKLKEIVFSWPMLLIFVGIVNFFKRHWISGILFILVGKFFLVPNLITAYPTLLPGLNSNFVEIYWPMLFIIAGVVIVIQKIFFRDYNAKCHEKKWTQFAQKFEHRENYSGHNNWKNSAEGFSKNSIFGGGEHIVLDPEFKGGELNAVFGGLTLDLRRTNLAEGETHLDINAVFGGITIFLPSEWFVETHIDAVFGGFQDNRMAKEPVDQSRKLVITGACVFGGGEIRN
jgi:predicted membrane protein